MEEARIPIYLVTGFLDSGKTTLFTDTLSMDYFSDGQRTVLIACEEGEEEYDQQQLSHQNVRLVPVEDQSALTPDFLDEIDRRYQPQRVLLEYNGMWPLDTLRNLDLPDGWGLFQVITVINASTFELYRSNMQSMIADMVSEADLVLFNRCKPEMELANWKRSIKALSSRAEIIFEDAEGEELEVEDILPYDLEQNEITLENDDYGIWYLHIQDHPELYVGKTITFNAQVFYNPKFGKTQFVPGRNAMTCCADDIRFFGFLCKYDKAKQLKKASWITLTAEIRYEESPVYSGEGVVLYTKSLTPATAPKDPLVYFR